MAASRTTFEKLQRDRAKQAKAAAKREKRQQRASETESAEPVDVTTYGEELSAPQLLELVEKLHKQYDDKVISFDEFEEQKTELLARLPVD